jgi:hypothetical protein
MGAAVGLAFQWKVLLPIIVMLPFAAIIFSVSRGLGHVDAIIVLLAAEATLQVGYFTGLLIRSIANGSLRSAGALSPSKRRPDPKMHDNDTHTTPPAGTG